MHCWCGFPGIAAASQVCIAGAKGQADGNNGHSSMRACNHQHIALRLNGVMLKTAKQVMCATSLWELTWSFCCSAWRCLLAFRAWSSACTSAVWYFTCASACGCSCHQSCMHACMRPLGSLQDGDISDGLVCIRFVLFGAMLGCSDAVSAHWLIVFWKQVLTEIASMWEPSDGQNLPTLLLQRHSV